MALSGHCFFGCGSTFSLAAAFLLIVTFFFESAGTPRTTVGVDDVNPREVVAIAEFEREITAESADEVREAEVERERTAELSEAGMASSNEAATGARAGKAADLIERGPTVDTGKPAETSKVTGTKIISSSVFSWCE